MADAHSTVGIPKRVRADLTGKTAQEREDHKREWFRQWRAANKDRINAAGRAHYRKNKAAIMAARTKDYERYLEKHREYNRRCRVKTIDRVKARARRYYEANKDRINAKSAEWAKANPLKRKQSVSKWLAKNPSRRNELHRLRCYNLSPSEFETLRQAQSNACAICEKTLPRKCHIDHCHETGAVRGLLCAGCNTGLGKFGDSVEGLRRAIRYLEASDVEESRSA